ncbi:MAG: hypothetical protein Q8R28_01685 [Dehalococcoidia bacterium]|nr:hypothetical protein [Dehalococcoidia bacterium]
MSFIAGRAQCDQCGKSLVLSSGVLILMEMASNPLRTPLDQYPLYHFCDLDELTAWVQDVEQVIKR